MPTLIPSRIVTFELVTVALATTPHQQGKYKILPWASVSDVCARHAAGRLETMKLISASALKATFAKGPMQLCTRPDTWVMDTVTYAPRLTHRAPLWVAHPGRFFDQAGEQILAVSNFRVLGTRTNSRSESDKVQCYKPRVRQHECAAVANK